MANESTLTTVWDLSAIDRDRSIVCSSEVAEVRTE